MTLYTYQSRDVLDSLYSSHLLWKKLAAYDDSKNDVEFSSPKWKRF